MTVLVLFDDSIIKVRKLIAAGVSVDGPPRSPDPDDLFYMSLPLVAFPVNNLSTLPVYELSHLYDTVIKQHQQVQHSH